jgi:hypothetical protein
MAMKISENSEICATVRPARKPGALAEAHIAHDGEHDERIADKHEEGEDHGRADMGAEFAEIERHAQRDEEEEKQEVAQGGEPGGDRLAVARRGERDAGEQPAQLLAEAREFADGGKDGGHGDGEAEQELGRAGHALGQRIGDIAHEDDDEDEQREARAEHEGDVGDAALARRADSDGRQGDHGQHDDEVLHDEETQRDLAVQRIDLALVGEELHDDDGGGEGERDGDVEALHRAEAERQADQEAEHRGEGDLAEAGHQRDDAQRADQIHVELDADEEEQNRDAELGQELDLLPGLDDVEDRRSRDQPDRDEGHDQRLAQEHADKADGGGKEEQERDFRKHAMGDEFEHEISAAGSGPTLRNGSRDARRDGPGRTLLAAKTPRFLARRQPVSGAC